MLTFERQMGLKPTRKTRLLLLDSARSRRSYQMWTLRSLLVGLVVVFQTTATTSLPTSATHDAVILRTLVLASSEFEEKKVEVRLQQAFREIGKQARFVKISMFDSAEAAVLLDHKGVIDGGFALWRTLFADYEKRIPPAAELLAIDKNIAIRLRDKRGRVSTRVVSGLNPYEVNLSEQNLTIAHVAITSTGDAEQNEERLELTFFVVTSGAVDAITARQAFESLSKTSPVPHISVVVRRDPWFIGHSDFPVVSPFLATAVPPSEDDYYNAPEAICICADGRVDCWDDSGNHFFFNFPQAAAI